MNPLKPLIVLVLFLLAGWPAAAQIPRPSGPATRGDLMISNYFRDQVLTLSSNCLANVQSLDDWTSHRAQYRRQLQEMLGLWPMPKKTDLKPVVTGRLTNADFTVEKIEFQALPRLYCTANLYLPRRLARPAPTILYECGHWSFKTNGISYGNKAVYQFDGAWYARNGYVCLVLDTVLAGEIPGIHTGTRDHGLWWWNSRGYTPAGVEAFLGIRALDYLCTRPEVDTNRLGITGHSGGGAYSWTITALDDRIKAAAPLAGMADMRSHMLDGVIDNHCDCNFFINIHHWDFPQVAALAAPRPLLIGGTDRDPLFHLDSTVRIYEKVGRIYQLYHASTRLGLAIAPGIHDEVPELRVAVLRWFNRYLKGEDAPVEVDARRFFAPAQLKVFKTLPTDSINSNIADFFVPMAKPKQGPADDLRAELLARVFSGWPRHPAPLDPREAFSLRCGDAQLSAWDFTSQKDISLRVYFLKKESAPIARTVSLRILDEPGWTNWLAALRSLDPGPNTDLARRMAAEFNGSQVNPSGNAAALEKLENDLNRNHGLLAFFAPRGAGLTAFSGDDKRLTKIRRRFMLLGQTLDGMRVWDIRRAVDVIEQTQPGPVKIRLEADHAMAVNALYAALFEPGVDRLDLVAPPASQKYDPPDYPGVLKVTDIPQVEQAVASGARLNIQTR